VVRTILHVDMDAFYAAVEQRDHPGYLGKPVIVGSDPKQGRGRGIVATCSYEARRFGIHSAQPISRAWKLCPQGIYVRPDMQKYARVSNRVMDILAGFTDLLEQVSIDEAFLDVSGSERLFGTGVEIAKQIKRRIVGELHLTASVGVAGNKFLAKVASDLKKPDGLVIVEPGREKEFLAPLPVGRLWGVGPKTEAYLKSLGLERVGQLADLPKENCVARMGRGGIHLLQLARGVDDRPVLPEEGFKSIGHEITFESDTADLQVIEKTLLDLTERVCRRLRKNGVLARTVAVKFREADFTTRSRRTTLDKAADTTEIVFPAVLKLLRSLFRDGVAVRLIGVHSGSLEMDGNTGQASLFDAAPRKDRRLAEAMDAIVQRFGSKSITRAVLVPPTKPENR
jgi:DNA polymerase-4